MDKWTSKHRSTEKSGHRLAAEKTLFPRRWYEGYDFCKLGDHLGKISLKIAFQVSRITSDAGIHLTLEPAVFDAISPAGPVQA